MTYNSSLPAPSDKLRNFPTDVTTNNWPRLKTLIGVDHQFNNAASADDGYHTVIHQKEQSTPSAITNVLQQYAKTVAGGNLNPTVKVPDSSSGANPEMLLPISLCMGAFEGTATPGVCTPVGVTFNCSVVRTSTLGLYTVTITNPSVDANYIPFVQPFKNVLSNVNPLIRSKGMTTFTVAFTDSNSVGVDPTQFFVQVFYLPGAP